MELSDLPPNISPRTVAEFLGYSMPTVWAQCRNYTARADAFVASHGHPWAHDSQDALPRDGEIPARYIIRPHTDPDGMVRGGRLRVYRDLLLWQHYGVRDYGHRAVDKAAVA